MKEGIFAGIINNLVESGLYLNNNYVLMGAVPEQLRKNDFIRLDRCHVTELHIPLVNGGCEIKAKEDGNLSFTALLFVEIDAVDKIGKRHLLRTNIHSHGNVEFTEEASFGVEQEIDSLAVDLLNAQIPYLEHNIKSYSAKQETHTSKSEMFEHWVACEKEHTENLSNVHLFLKMVEEKKVKGAFCFRSRGTGFSKSLFLVANTNK